MDTWRKAIMNEMVPAMMAEFGETVRFTRVDKRPNYSGRPDPRTAFTTCAIFKWPSTMAMQMNTERSRMDLPIITRDPCVTVPVTALVWRPVKGDQVELLERDELLAFEIVGSHPDGAGLIKYELVQLGQHSPGEACP
jgi:hypothetical protein